MKSYKLLSLLIFLILLSTTAYCALPPTIKVNGKWDSLGSLFIVHAVIDGQNETVCLPKIEFKEEIDKAALYKDIVENIESQDAVFQLYHDGLGSPKKEMGMFFASDIFLKDLDMTYTGYLRKLGLKFSISNERAYEDSDYLDQAYTSAEAAKQTRLIAIAQKGKKEKEKKNKEELQEKISKSNLRVATVYDVLPQGVIPPSIRSQQEKIAAIVNNLKTRPYKTEIIQQDPLRWASGYMGILNEKGEIDMAKCEGQIIDFVIRVPEKAGWLTPEMLKEIQNTPCEYILSRYKNGLEVVEGTRYLLHDIYFGKLKLTWAEWLEKHGHKCPEFIEKPEYATGVIPIEIHTVDGIFKSLDALSVCQINFTEKSNLVYPQEIMRVFPPKPKPEDRKTMLKFLKAFNEAYKGKRVNVHIMVCPGGKSYSELGQKRIKRMRFNETSTMFDVCEQEILKKLKEEK